MILGPWSAGVGVAVAVAVWALVLGVGQRGVSGLPFALAGVGAIALLA